MCISPERILPGIFSSENSAAVSVLATRDFHSPPQLSTGTGHLGCVFIPAMSHVSSRGVTESHAHSGHSLGKRGWKWSGTAWWGLRTPITRGRGGRGRLPGSGVEKGTVRGEGVDRSVVGR